MNFLYKSKLSFLYLFLLFLISVKCDNPDKFELPGVYLNFTININTDVQYYSLQSGGNSMEILASSVGLGSLGYDDNGIIVYNNGGEFYAFDRTCPHEFPASSIAVDGDEAGSAKCPECGSTFLFPGLGLPTSGSASRYPLKEYKTQFFANSGVLRVYN